MIKLSNNHPLRDQFNTFKRLEQTAMSYLEIKEYLNLSYAELFALGYAQFHNMSLYDLEQRIVKIEPWMNDLQVATILDGCELN